MVETATETRTVETQSLWRHSDFRQFWLAETITQFGTQFSGLAIPITAIIYLKANAIELGILGFAGTVSWLLFGLLVGVYVDRHRRQRIMITSNIFRGIILALIPIAAVAGLITRLGLPLLYVVSFLVGLMQVFFDVSYQSYLPSLVRREQLIQGNSMLEASRSLGQVFGPTLAGIVIAIITAPIAIMIDAISFIASAITLGRIGKKEDLIDRSLVRPSIKADIREGLAIIFNDNRLRSIAATTGTSNFFGTAAGAILFLYFVTRTPDGLGLPESSLSIVVGIIFSIASIGALIGVLTASPLQKRLGLGPAIILGALFGGSGQFAFYFAGPATASPLLTILGFALTPSILLMMSGQFLTFIGVVVYNINQVSFRQAIVPIRLQGRMNASMRFLIWGTIPLGAIAGGIMGTFLGLRTAIGISSLGGSLTFLWVLFSPVRSLKTMPEPLG